MESHAATVRGSRGLRCGRRAERLDGLLVFGSKDAHLLSEPSADRTDWEFDPKIGVGLRDRLMHPARTDLRLVQREALHFRSLVVVPLNIAGDDRADNPASGVVLVRVDLGRLPTKQPLLAHVQRAGKGQAVSELAVVDDERGNFGARFIPCSCNMTTSVMSSRRSA